MTEGSFAYRAHGLSICSTVPLGLEAIPDSQASQADVTIRCITGAPPTNAGAGELLIRYDNGVTYRITDGRDVIRFGDTFLDDVALEFLTGPALAIALFQREHAVLHCSCVRIAGRLVALVGASGEGKSTLAAALVRRGHELFADDFIAFGQGGVVHPGVARLRLWPDSAAAVGMGDGDEVGKRAIPVDGSGASGTQPILFVLQNGSTDTITAMRPADVLYHLLSNSYCVSLLASADMSGEFERWSRLALELQCLQMTRVAGLDRLDDTAVLLERFVAQC